MIFKGSATALITPFTENGVDLNAYEKLLNFQISNGTDALVVLGTTGEPATMTAKEKEEVISRFYQLMQYVNVHYVEEQQKVKIYPLLVCLWGNLVIEGKDTEGSFEIFEKTLELLRKQKSLYCLLEINLIVMYAIPSLSVVLL